jgi:hypothetical protein
MYYDIVPSSPSIFWSYQFQMIENGTILWSSSQSGTGNRTCVSLGLLNIPKGVVNATAKATSLATAQEVRLYFEIETTCNSIGLVHINGTANGTGDGYNLYSSQIEGGGFYNSSQARDSWMNSIPQHCVIQPNNQNIVHYNVGITNWNINWTTNNMDYPRKDCTTGNQTTECPISSTGLFINWYGRCACNFFVSSAATGLYATGLFYYLPFNSKLGIADINIYSHDIGFFTSQRLEIIKPSDSTIVYDSGYISTPNITVNVSLEQFVNYVLIVQYSMGSGYQTAFRPPEINLTINDYTPAWSCDAWSACSGGYQTRLCNDTGMVVPPEFQTRSCLAVNQTAILGFENYYVPADRYICQPNIFPLCSLLGNIITNVTVLFPDNPRWAIVPNSIYYYIGTINSETATLGSRSLKLWYIPQSPYSDQPFNNNGTAACGNTTVGTFPEIFREINTSFMASLDFTFPAGTTELRFDVKRCDNNVVQYDGWCGKRCYAQNCTIPPSGDFIAALYDQVEAKNLFELTKEATTNWTTYIAFLGNAVEDRNYTLRFSVLPLPINPTTTEGNCIYIDNVRLVNTQVSWIDPLCEEMYGAPCNELTDEEIQNVLLENCVNECIGNDYHIRTIQDLTCIEEVVLNYSTCVTQYQQQQTGNQSIFLPIGSVANSIVNTTTNQTLAQSLQAQGFGFVLLFLTPIFWIMMIVIIAMGGLAYWTRHMEIGVAGGIIMMIVMASVFPELIWITIVVVIIAGYIIGRQVIRAVQG